MLRDDQRLARACSALLATVRLGRLWTENGPTPEASRLLALDGGRLSSEQRSMLLVAWTIWDGSGGAKLAAILGRFAADPMEAMCLLVAACKASESRPQKAEREVKTLMTTTGIAHGGRVRSTEPPVIDLPVADGSD